MSTLSTTIPATPMPDATGTETQPAPMVEVEPVAWQRLHVTGSSTGVTDTKYYANRWIAEGSKVRPLYAHPAPATLADETLRAEVEDTQNQWRDLALQFDCHRIQALSWLKAMLVDPVKHKEGAASFVSSPPLSGEKVLAERLAALSQPAPVVEDGTAREGYCAPMENGKPGSRIFVLKYEDAEMTDEIFSDEETARQYWRARDTNWNCHLLATLPLAPEGQNAEASLREELACALEELIDHNGDDLNDTRAKRVAELRATTPAVPDGRTEEVEKLTQSIYQAEAQLRSISYHARNGHQDRPLWKRLSIINEHCDLALAALSEHRT